MSNIQCMPYEKVPKTYDNVYIIDISNSAITGRLSEILLSNYH